MGEFVIDNEEVVRVIRDLELLLLNLVSIDYLWIGWMKARKWVVENLYCMMIVHSWKYYFC